MSENFEPRTVEPTAWRRWLREGFALYKRHPVASSVLVAAYTAVFSIVFVVVPELGFFVLTLLFPLQLLTLFVRNARYSDRSEAPGQMLIPLGLNVYGRLTLLAMLFTIVFAMLTMALLLLLNGLEATGATSADAAARVFDYLFVGDTYSLVFIYGVIFFSELITVIILFLHLFDLWFAPALMYFDKLALREAVLLSRHAVRLNRQVVGKMELLLATAVLVNTFLTLGLFILILLPVAGAALYVAYRDVFLGIKENAPEPMAARQGELLTGLNH